jgi:glycosyltransferase involved in cell wall biosynthesis
MNNIYIVIAAYNESSQIKDVIESLISKGFFNIIVIDDGSLDGTAIYAKKAGAITLIHPINLGQGAALQTGVDFALAQGASYIVTFDADNQHDVDDIVPAISCLEKSGAAICLGSRFKGKTINMPLTKRITLKAAIFFTQLTTGLSISDAHNGFRVFTNRGARKIRIRQNRMAHASEILNQIAERKISYIEHPVTIRYTTYSISKGQKISNSVSILKDLFIGGQYK